MKRPSLLFALLVSTLALAGCGKTPDRLASDLKQALDKQDVDALLAMADLQGAPADAYFMLMDLPDDCIAPVVCTVTLKPIDDKWLKEDADSLKAQQGEWQVKPEGLVRIEARPDPAAKSQAGSMNMEMPYARVGDGYKLVMAHPTAARVAELKGTTPQAATDATLAKGIGKPGSSERDMDWKTTATPLPPGGGEAGAAYLARVAKVGAALKAQDVDALAAALGEWGRMVLGPKDFSGKDVPPDKRKRKMRSQGMRLVVSAQVLGGYELGDQAVLTVEGSNGAGGTVRGAALMERKDGAWESFGSDMIEIPAGT